MTFGPEVRVARTAFAWSAVVLAVAVLAGSAVDRLEAGIVGPWPLARLLGPPAVAFGVAAAVGALRQRGDWDGWSALGYGPLVLARASLLGFAAVGLLELAVPSAAPSVLALPPPVAQEAELWWTGSAWERADLRAWQRAPGTLAGPELIRRARRRVPEGGRVGVDRAELLRRGGWAAAWPLAALLGFGAGLRAPRPREDDEARALRRFLPAAFASAGLVGWLIAVLAVVAAVASG